MFLSSTCFRLNWLPTQDCEARGRSFIVACESIDRAPAFQDCHALLTPLLNVCESQRDVTAAPTSTTITPSVTVSLTGFTLPVSTETSITSLTGAQTSGARATTSARSTSVADGIGQGVSGGDEGDTLSAGAVVAIVIIMVLFVFTFVVVMIKRQRRQKPHLPEFEKEHDSRMFGNPMINEAIPLNSFDTLKREPNQEVTCYTDGDVDPNSPTISETVSETSFIVSTSRECQPIVWNEENESTAINRSIGGRERAKSIHLAPPVFSVARAAVQLQHPPEGGLADSIDVENPLWTDPSDSTGMPSSLSTLNDDDGNDFIDGAHPARPPTYEDASVMLAGKRLVFADTPITVQMDDNGVDAGVFNDGCTACDTPIECGPRKHVELNVDAVKVPAIEIDTLKVRTPTLVLDMGSATPTLILGTDATPNGGVNATRWTEGSSESETDGKQVGDTGAGGSLAPGEYRDRSSSVC